MVQVNASSPPPPRQHHHRGRALLLTLHLLAVTVLLVWMREINFFHVPRSTTASPPPQEQVNSNNKQSSDGSNNKNKKKVSTNKIPSNNKKNNTSSKTKVQKETPKIVKKTATESSSANDFAFGFYLLGDSPYSAWEEGRLEEQMQQINQHYNAPDDKNAHYQFVLHVGDVQKVTYTHCEDWGYERASSILQASGLPVVVLPGDNDWYDCPNQTKGWEDFSHHFANFAQKHWPESSKTVFSNQWRQSSDHWELIAFEMHGILMFTIHLVNMPPKDPWYDPMMAKNKKWITKVLKEAFAPERKDSIPRGILLLGHSLRSPNLRPLFDYFAGHFASPPAHIHPKFDEPKKLKNAKDIPIIYLHGDGHDWKIDSKLAHQWEWPNYRDIQVDMAANSDPVLVQVTQKEVVLEEAYTHDQVYTFGMFHLDRQRGLFTQDPNRKKKIEGLDDGGESS